MAVISSPLSISIFDSQGESFHESASLASNRSSPLGPTKARILTPKSFLDDTQQYKQLANANFLYFFAPGCPKKCAEKMAKSMLVDIAMKCIKK